ncbi:sigma 54-interacting transcriptional regulator [Candidatus Aalborgicola defluviihabitans]|jgi:two-component system response regulator GlrR|uniref:sigma 54-interacting transcriptional regulator n=1 Tax=Candidatus Aalborgicola defluviihabitans TaxID=3386187 RepID=UPI001D30F510|nr:sigma 54-interacting transcriptional regulator [Burkholderiales bacterium]MBK7282432.1 sigma 54-interacting transcriptional regulator [Burkholderiales bacterium]MBK7314175.1 sigma 54-interacting transcriptional regulator [Burkholderiales bacterium]MBL0244879.1 sigma 54-interacting transcriptional regulator [Rhodoferax sp.]
MARILIVDDDPSLLRLLSLRLHYEGHTAIEANSGAAAMALLDRELPHLMITDLRMPGMDGLQLFNAVHRRFPLLPVLMLTANGTIPDAVAAMQKGIFGYITKPFEGADLMREVDRALEVSAALGADMPGEEAGESWREAIITRSPRMEKLLAEARLIAQSDASVLIHGESGTGKELLARALHASGPRCQEAMVAVNCGAIPENLVESELFGHVKGAFTGAVRDSVGLFTSAHRGTIFLDEIADLPITMQVKLLRVLQEREVRPVGSAKAHKVDVRVISASNRKLEDEVAAGRFREDLFYRLHVIGLSLPPLGERREDIALLAHHFMRSLSQRYAKPIAAFAPGALEQLSTASWPGNVRQLQNVVEKCVVLCTGSLIPVSLVQSALTSQGAELLPFDDARKEFERDYLTQLLKITHGNVTQAAKLAQRNRTDFYALLARHQLESVNFKA